MAQNDPSALSAEALQTRVRLSLSSELNLNIQPYALFWQNPSTIRSWTLAMTAFALNQYDYYSWHPDPYLRGHAWEWLILAQELAFVPASWAGMIGSFESTQVVGGQVFFVATANDGVVPWTSSSYPGGIPVTLPESQYGNLPHTSQTDNPTITAEVSLRLRSFMNVVLRPPVFSASISGAAVVPPGQTCNYAPSVLNGVGPFSYEWYSNNTLVGTSQFLSLSVNDPGVFLSLVVRDATNAVASAGLQLTTDLFSSGCF